MTLQIDDYFLFLLSPWGTHLSSFFTFQACFKCRRTIGCLKLSSFIDNFLGSSKRISFHNPFNLPLSTSNGWPMFSSSKFSSTLQNFLNHHCTLCLLAVPGPNASLMLWVVSTALWSILNSSKKIAQICFV